ncbi:MAG TPA: hypothetical protein VH593_31855 [Ktedonobacteraceae bacterium]|jgi:hypothetical protein
MIVEDLIAELAEWPSEAKVIVTLVQGDKTPRRFEIDEVNYSPPVGPDTDEIGEIIILEGGEF